jgi:uncharacterized membrane protein YkvA (DUF1232 family)
MTATDQDGGFDPGFGGAEATREARIRDRLWRTARRAARQIPFLDEVVAGWYCALDPQTPTKVRLTLLAALAYFVAPIDALPDLLPLVGFSDDAGVLLAALTMVGSHVTDVHREAARRALDEE